MSEEQEGQGPNSQPNQENSQNPQNPQWQQNPQGSQGFNRPNPNNPFPPYGGGFGGMQMALPNATIVLVLGILSIVTCCCFYGVVGLVLGIVALILSRKDKQNYLANMSYYTLSSYKNLNAGRVCAIIGLILSGIILLLCVLFAIFFGFSTLTDEEAIRQMLKELQ
ncbi:CCC motif membrane protein [Pedobacter nanyangensis]|uniref:CCC motif membrane protein n=1 Tax=Pedobacter nanyangensis TaxID=1562389 RepID=UPI0019629F72|nr:CCC motif membrane protein [Pedobacter nanyangensis]